MSLKGKKITEVRRMTDEELASEGWNDRRGRPPVLVLDDGTKLYPSMDSEGNSGGVLFGVDDNRSFYVNP